MEGALAGAALLDARDAGARLHMVDRALMLLALAEPEGVEDWAALPLAARDRRLIALRRATFGDGIACIADCPACAAPQEFALSAQALLAGVTDQPPETLAADGWEIAIRSPDSRDLAAAAATGDSAAAAALLLARAMRVSGRGGPPPPELIAAAEARVAERAAEAEIALDLTCAECGAGWIEAFDIVQLLWIEVEAAARRLIGEVAALAARFSWSEADVLAMGAARRAAYLQAGGAA